MTKHTAMEKLLGPRVNEDVSDATQSKIASAAVDLASRYRSSNRLEYRLNLNTAISLLAIASSMNNDSDANRLYSIAQTLNREFGELK